MRIESNRSGATLLAAAIACATLGAAPPQDEASIARARAAEHFERGVSLMKAGTPEQASAEFRAAYEASPHYSTLLNLGQAEAAAGRPVEATEVLRRYLDLGGENLEGPRRAQAEALLQRQERRIGLLELDAPEGAKLIVDGVSLGKAPAPPFRVREGAHGLVVLLDEHIPHIETVQVVAGATTRVAARPATERVIERLGQIRVECPVPDVRVNVDTRHVPSEGTIVDAGEHVVSFDRTGYLSTPVKLDVRPGSAVNVRCALTTDPSLGASAGTIHVDGAPPDAEILLDDAPLGRLVPPGKHRLAVTHPDFQLWSRDVTVAPGRTDRVPVAMVPTARYRNEVQAARQKRKMTGVVLATGGSVLLGAGAAVYLWNNARYDDFRAGTAGSPEAAGIQQADDAALGLVISGGVALVAGVILLVTGESEWAEVAGK